MRNWRQTGSKTSTADQPDAMTVRRLGIYEVNLNKLPLHERVNPLSRTFSGPTPTASWLSEQDLGGSARRRAARRKAKEWTAPKMGSFPWTDVRRLNGFKQFADPPRCVVSWDAYQGGKTEVPVHTTLEKGNRTKYKAPRTSSSSSQHRPRSRQRPLMSTLDDDAREMAVRSGGASRESARSNSAGRLRTDGTVITHFPDGRPSTADSMASSRSAIFSRASARDGALGSRGSSAGRSQPAPWDMLEFLESVERKARIPSVRPASRGGRVSLGASMNSSLGGTLWSSRSELSSPAPAGGLGLPPRPSTSAGFTNRGVLSSGRAAMTGQFEPERVIILTNVPVDIEPVDLAAALSEKFGPLCYVSIQPSDDGSGIGWAIATFTEHGPAASAVAKARVLIDVSTATGPPEEFGLDQPSRKPPTVKTTLTLPIDKLAFKVSQRVTSRASQPRNAMACYVHQHLTSCLRCLQLAEATAVEEMQLKDAFKSYSRSTSILLSIRNVLLAARVYSAQNRPMSTAAIEAATLGRVDGKAAHEKLREEGAFRHQRAGKARFTSLGIDR